VKKLLSYAEIGFFYVKRIFTIIVILVTISLVGIIMLQLSWLNNMILLRQEQIKEKINQAVALVGTELSQYKGNLTTNKTVNGTTIFPDEFSLDFLRPQTIGKRFTVQELNEKIMNAFKTIGLEKMNFEFELALMNPRTNLMGTTERQSNSYEKEYADTVNNYSRGALLISPSGSAAEGVAIDETLTIVALNWRSFALQSLRWRFAIAIFFTIIIISAFYLTLRTMLRQKKLAKIKNDFINNMTHEFKTPIATISLAVDAMRNEKVMEDREKMSYFSTIIKDENQRMNRQVETILKASQLEKQQAELNLKPVHVHEIIKDVVDNFTLQLGEKNGKAEMTLNATDDLIEADEVHFSNLVNNLVDNAVKYSKENTPPVIKLSTESNARHFYLRIEDNGIGMNRENIEADFRKILQGSYRKYS
jgi:two-component system phosphate regulon sensor histidine kinase PhoR